MRSWLQKGLEQDFPLSKSQPLPHPRIDLIYLDRQLYLRSWLHLKSLQQYQKNKKVFRNSDLTDEELSTQDPLQGTLAFDENAENLEILENLIKDQAEVDDEEVRTPYPKFNEPFVTRNSVDMGQDIYVHLDADSEEDFDQEDYLAYGHADPSLKNF